MLRKTERSRGNYSVKYNKKARVLGDDMGVVGPWGHHFQQRDKDGHKLVQTWRSRNVVLSK